MSTEPEEGVLNALPLEEAADLVCSILEEGIVHEVAPGPFPASRFLRSSQDFSLVYAVKRAGTTVIAVASVLRAGVAHDATTQALLTGWGGQLPTRTFFVIPHADGADETLGVVVLQASFPFVLLADKPSALTGGYGMELLRSTIYAPSELAGGVQSESQTLDGLHVDINQLGGRPAAVPDVVLAANVLIPA